MDFLSNGWITNLTTNYSTALGIAPVVIYAILRLVATINPNVSTNRVLDLLMGLLKKKESEKVAVSSVISAKPVIYIKLSDGKYQMPDGTIIDAMESDYSTK